MANRTNVLIAVLVLIIVVLAGIVVYSFVVKPAYSGYVAQKQLEGEQITVVKILSQLQENGFVQIPIGNQTLILVQYVPPEQQIQQAETPSQ